MPNRYKNITVTKTNLGRTYRRSTIYPDIPVTDQDIYVIVADGDRYDILAQTYYGDPSLWWVIATANSSNNRASLNPISGTQIRIPYNKQEAVNLFNSLNNNR
jgi:hypothetical protein|tara:strand:+ start:203 stop:511 length:309 start_codon:yes stop_codon:yes gene_type:complete